MEGESFIQSQILKLIDIDQLDRAIHSGLQAREAIRLKARKLKTDVEDAQAAIATLEEESRGLETKCALDEKELKRVQEKLKRVGSFEQVTSEKELHAAEREVVVLKATRDALEETVLAEMERQESLAGELVLARQRLEQARRRQREEQPGLKEQFDALGGRVEAERAERLRVLPGLDEELRRTYERLIDKFKDRAATTLREGRCQHCVISVPPQHMVDVLMGKSWHCCQHCGRLLLPEPTQ